MSLPRYGEYKDSGIAWVGELPAHWGSHRTKTLFELMKRPPRDEDGVVTAFRDGEVTLRTNRRTDGFTNSLQEIGYQGVRRGDLVIHAMDAFAGAIGVSDSDGKSTPVYAVCRPRLGLSDSRYYGRLLRHMALSGFIESMAKGIRERSTEFRWAEAGNVYLPVPPVTEQAAIAAFLDRETAKIDALIAEQEKLIALMAEKRQATISHAVTRGLDPKAPMKDSGVAWLGNVPAHWRVLKVKHTLIVLTDFTANGSFASLAENVEYLLEGFSRLVRLTDLREGLANDGLYVDEGAHNYLSKSELFGGEVLIANVGAHAGYACLMPTTQQKATLGPNMYLMRFDEEVTTNPYMNIVLSSRALREQLSVAATSTAQPKLNKDDVKGCSLVLPPSEEQLQIQDFLRRELAAMDSLVEAAEKVIELLRERRSALIAAAVTGQIDVRGVMSASLATWAEFAA